MCRECLEMPFLWQHGGYPAPGCWVGSPQPPQTLPCACTAGARAPEPPVAMGMLESPYCILLHFRWRVCERNDRFVFANKLW